MREEDQQWMAYIDAEINAVCQPKGWRRQIRRKWSVREKPVSDSPIEDFEWKLIPDPGRFPDAEPDDFEGTYYILWFDKPDFRFVFQHDTSHSGVLGPHFERETYTEIRPGPFASPSPLASLRQPGVFPQSGWLRDHLVALIARFAPNDFSST